MRRIVSPILLALLLAGLLANAAQAKERVKGPGYRTHAPTGWVIDKQSGGGAWSVQITPPGHVMNMRDSALISIWVTSVKGAESVSGVKIRNKNAMVQKLISVPDGVGGLGELYKPRPTTLRNKAGVTFGVHYNYKGKGSTHTATLVRRGKRVYLIQVIKDEDLSQLGESASDMITSDWRWK